MSMLEPWTLDLTDLLDDRVKMSGLSMNCLYDSHIQSMVFALDRIGVQVIKDSGAIFDCLKEHPDLTEKKQYTKIVHGYEVKMGKVIRDAGYAIRPLIEGIGRTNPMIVSNDDDKNKEFDDYHRADCRPCKRKAWKGKPATNTAIANNTNNKTVSCEEREMYGDIWFESTMKWIYGGEIPTLDELVFFKTSRFLPDEIKTRINFTGTYNWNKPVRPWPKGKDAYFPRRYPEKAKVSALTNM